MAPTPRSRPTAPRTKRNLVQVLLTVFMVSMLAIVLARRFSGAGQTPTPREAIERNTEYREQAAGHAADIRLALRQQAARAQQLTQQEKTKTPSEPATPVAIAPPLPPEYSKLLTTSRPLGQLSDEQKLSLERAKATLNDDTEMAVYEIEDRRALENPLGTHTGDKLYLPNLTPLPIAAAAAPTDPHPHTALQHLMSQPNTSFPAVSHDQRWLQRQSEYTSSQPLFPTVGSSPYLLMMGEPIPAVTLQKINSDLPGTVRAMVTRDMYDSIRGRFKVIPRGTILIGLSNADVSVGQSRLLIAFNRINFPSGAYLDISGVPATERSGSAGLDAHVNNHFLRQFGQAFLVAGIATWAGRQQSAPPNMTINLTGTTLPATFSQAAAQTLSEVVRRMLDRHQNIKPTLTLPAGEKITIIVARDMVLPPAVVSNYESTL